MQQRHGLLEIDDVDAVALAEDVRRHLRVPAAGGVAEMNASFQELAHRNVWDRHEVYFSGWSAAGLLYPGNPDTGATAGNVSPGKAAKPACEFKWAG